MTQSAAKNGPLHGIRVLDLTRVLSGPYCTMMLADQGADVIKIEIPGKGDDTRHLGPPFRNDVSAFFISINRNKRSVTLNLKKPEGVAILRELVANSDVLVENYRPGVADRLGIGYESLRKVNHRLIYCSISGFGQTGPYRDLPGYNFTVQALSGVMTVSGEPGGRPMPVGISLGDIPAGMFAAFAVAVALNKRAETGVGQHLDIAMLDSLLAMMENPIVRFGMTGVCPLAIGRFNPSITPFGVFETTDSPIVVAAGNDKLWCRLCVALELTEISEDPRFATNPLRTENASELYALLDEHFATRTSRKWLDVLIREGVPAAPVLSVADVFEDPHVQSRGSLVRVKQARAGEVTIAASPVRSNVWTRERYEPAPQLGKDTEQVLKTLLRKDEHEVDRLRHAGVI